MAGIEKLLHFQQNTIAVKVTVAELNERIEANDKFCMGVCALGVGVQANAACLCLHGNWGEAQDTM
ncbi:hypothetical protein [Ruegeria denitrificans]|uniref:hypothetical protein n=1 Tax=Ruegeria denitrificans TaxID=1715692 RepID=UPI00071E3CA7|nr:hypothetical protein [Ruegeria denitrificans]